MKLKIGERGEAATAQRVLEGIDLEAILRCHGSRDYLFQRVGAERFALEFSGEFLPTDGNPLRMPGEDLTVVPVGELAHDHRPDLRREIDLGLRIEQTRKPFARQKCRGESRFFTVQVTGDLRVIGNAASGAGKDARFRAAGDVGTAPPGGCVGIDDLVATAIEGQSHHDIDETESQPTDQQRFAGGNSGEIGLGRVVRRPIAQPK